MDNDFFSFETSMPALGAGSMELGSELMEAPEDEETFDVLNDETFGDIGEGDFNWEEEHEKLSSFHKDFGDGDLQGVDQYEAHEDALEQRISQLVVDDDEMDDPAIMTITKRQPIPQRRDVNLDNLFGPSSPPGFLSSDHLVSPGKTNIWGSPVQNNSLPKKEEDVQNILQMLKGPSANGHGEVKDPSIVYAGKSVSGSGQARADPVPPPQSRTRAITVEQLEMEMRGELPDLAPPLREPARFPGATQPPIGTPPSAHFINQSQRPADSRSSPITILGRGMPPSSLMNKHTPSPGAKMSPQACYQQSHYSVASLSPTPPKLMSHLTALSGSPPASPILLSPTSRAVWSSVSPQCGFSFPQSMPPVLFTSPTSSRLVPTKILSALSPPLKIPQQVSLRTQAALILQEHEADKCSLHLMSKILDSFGNLHTGSILFGSHSAPGRGMLPHSPPHFGRGDKSGPPPPFMPHGPGRPRGPYPGPPGPYGDPRDMRGPPRGPPPSHMRPQLFSGPGRGPRGAPPFGPSGRGGYPRDVFRDGNGRLVDARGDGPWRGGPGRGGGDWRGPGRGVPHRPLRPRHDSYHSGDDDFYDDDHEGPAMNRDPYANLMTQREKEWIIKIQLMQLHTDNPYVDDYYFTTWQMQRLSRQHHEKRVEPAAEPRRRDDRDKKKEPRLVLPQLAKVEMRNYKPVQFEGSLGRLTTSSVHNPRQIIDVDAKSIQSDEDPKAKELRKFKQLLIHVEKTYDVLLAIDELEKKALALPDEARPAVLLERHEKIEALQQRLMFEGTNDNSFLKLLTLKKGVKLLARSLPLFNKNQSSTLLLVVVQHVALLTKREMQRDLVASLELPIHRCLQACDLESLVVLSQTLTSQADNRADVAASTLQFEFGAVVIWNFISRGAEIYRDVSPVDLDVKHQNEWSQFVYWVAQGIESVEKEQLCRPTGVSDDILVHLRQLLDRKTFLAIEDKLQVVLGDEHDES